MEEGAAFPLAFPVLVITLLRGEMVKILPPLLPHACFLPISKGPEAISTTVSEFIGRPGLLWGVTSRCQHRGDAASKAFEVYSRKTLLEAKHEEGGLKRKQSSLAHRRGKG